MDKPQFDYNHHYVQGRAPYAHFKEEVNRMKSFPALNFYACAIDTLMCRKLAGGLNGEKTTSHVVTFFNSPTITSTATFDPLPNGCVFMQRDSLITSQTSHFEDGDIITVTNNTEAAHLSRFKDDVPDI